MHKFDYSFLYDGLMPVGLYNLAEQIGSLKTLSRIRLDDNLTLFQDLEKIAKVQSIKSSNAIEGIVTSDERIRAIVNQNSAPLNHNEAEIAGYRDALDLIHRNYESLDFSQAVILKLHEIMMQVAGLAYGGHYKKDDNVIMEIDSEGNRRIRFHPVSAEDTPKAMEQLELAYLDARDNAGVNRLLLIPCVILDFLCIHPFTDGNGRMSRLLSLMLLYKNGYDVGKYVSFEEQINKHKAYYYDALKASSQGWSDNTNTYFPFIENFLSMIYMCYKELDKRFLSLNARKRTKRALIEETVLNSLTPISKREICLILPDISPTTVEAVLGDMVKKGQIIRIGSARLSRYIKK